MEDVKEYSVKWTHWDSNRDCLKFDKVDKLSNIYKNKHLEIIHTSHTGHMAATTALKNCRNTVRVSFSHRRTGRHFTGRAEKICPENNNFP